MARFLESISRLRFLLAPKRSAELNEELQGHLDHSIRAKEAAGMDSKEARRLALIEFGGVQRAKEETYRQRPSWLAETFLHDLRYALRGFRRSPVFTLTVIATLALGIGASTAVFSVVDRILFRSLPYADDSRLVSIGLSQSLEKQEFMLGSFFYDWRDNQMPYVAMASESTGPNSCVLIEAEAQQLNCMNAQAALLPLLGVTPVIGRNFLPEEDRPNGPSVALITYALWKNHFGLDSSILNRLIDLNGTPVRIVGVLPQGFEMPTLQAADVLMPLALAAAKDQHSQNNGIGQPMRVFARLKPGISVVQARAEMDPLFRHTLQVLIPAEIRNDFHLSIRSLRDRQTEDVQLAAWVLLCSVLSVLLIACANVSSLMMARGASRDRELAVRSALGASRFRLIVQALTESFLLSTVGAVAGLAVAEGLLRIFISIAPTSVPFLAKAQLDLRVAGVAVLLSLFCGAVFGVAPALQKPRAEALVSKTSLSGRHARLRQIMVVGQIAISVVLLTGATLLLRSFQKMETRSLGIDAHRVLTVRMVLAGVRSDPVAGLVSRHGQHQMDLFLRAEAAVRHLPGVRFVGWSDSFPPGGGWQDGRRISDFRVAGSPAEATGESSQVRFRGVTPDYFRALDIPIVRGRNFAEEERTSGDQFMVLSRLLASHLFPDENAVGKRIAMGSDGTTYTVVGVAENVRNGGLSEEDLPEAYFLRHNIAADWGVPVPVMVVDTVLSPAAIMPWIRAQVHQIDPKIPIEIETLDQHMRALAERPRFETSLLGFFALIGLLMAAIGLYGVTAYLATQRTQEIGVRMALGASRAAILRLIAGEGLRLLIAGLAMGVGASLALTQYLRSLLFDVGPRDPATFAGVIVLLGSVALVAALIPARRATSVDPVVALRYE